MSGLMCVECGMEFEERYRGQAHAVETGRFRAYCSRKCSLIAHARRSSEVMARTNRKYASERMREHNPMDNAESREKMRQTLLDMGHQPLKRGGNGKPPPEPQRRMSEALGWPMEVVVKTGHCRDGSGYPTCYKIDVASREFKVGVEVDGISHQTRRRQQQDAKKDEFLRGLGWTVLRFANERVMENLEDCVQEVRSTISK